jgi:hypothetical protein
MRPCVSVPLLTVLPGRKVAEYQPQQGRDFNRPFERLSFGSVLHQTIEARLIRYGKSVSPLIMHWTRC